MHHADLYRCLKCRGSLTDRTRPDALSCVSCGVDYPIVHNVLDTLTDPSEDVIQELKANAREQGIPAEEWRSFRVRAVANLADMQALLKGSAHEPAQYYQQVTTNFFDAVERLGSRPNRRVLEIGSEYDYQFLEHFRRAGAECFAVNIRFSYLEPDAFLDWPEKVLADMNDLPFTDATFDTLVLSATSHHSANLDKTISEISRVLNVGGVALLLNDPLKGWLKWMGGATEPHHGRDEEIHENEYTIRQYDSAFRRAGLRPEYLFSAFHDRRLCEMDIHPEMRFARLAKLIGTIWKAPSIRAFAKRSLLRPGQMIFGFPLNVILRKA
ncbi:MAG: methyltransferase domain-containing protein [Candidatus Polarisedimenticolia bacterium]